ncbi:MAG: ribosome maturation factor RimM [Geobacteraceae bacterium]|nr:ribosome maturation factor RimM [Geobacteraceae bacterium]
MDVSDKNLIAVGRISGTHGIRGQVRLHSYSGNIESLQAAKSVLLRSPAGNTRQAQLKRAAFHSGKFLLTLDGFDTIEKSQELTGYELFLQRDQLPAPDADEYYWQDLLGLSVVTTEGQELGTLKDILETGANDVYLVRNEITRHEYLIPAIGSVITSINLQTRIMTITPLEGLLDL